jgi:hypothetical protein
MRVESIFVLLSLAILTGCGDGRLKVYPASGKVLVKGQPAEGAKVIFYTQNADQKQPGIPIPQGTVAADGTYSLTTYEPNDGAPAGSYAVTVVWNKVIVPDDDPESQVERDQLDGRYATPEKSGLTATVEAKENELPPFELK